MPRDAGYLYAIKAEGTPYVKVGRTSSTVEKRMLALQISQPFRLTIVASIHLENLLPAIEQQIHRLLASHRRHGEWFELTLDAETFLSVVEEATQRVKTAEMQKMPRKTGKDVPILAQRLRAALQEHKWTMKELSRRAGVPYDTVFNVLHGRRRQPHFQLVARLAGALEVSLDTLVDDEEEDPHAA